MSLAVSGVRKRGRRRRTILEQRYLNPGKGINVFVSEQFIDNQEGSNSMNGNIIESGAITKRNGWAKVGVGLVNAPRGLGSYYPTGSASQLLTIDGNQLKYLSGALWTPLPSITFGVSDRYTFVQAGGDMYIWNGVDGGARLSGLSLTRPATTPTAAYGIYYADKQIVSGVAAKPNRLYISSAVDRGDFTNASGVLSTAGEVPGASAFGGTDANYIDISPDDGDKITALSKYQSQLIIFKSRSIWSLNFDANGQPIAKLITNGIGCTSHWSIDTVDNDLIFLSRKGYYVLGTEAQFFDQLRTNELSIRIKPYIKAMTASRLNRASAIWHDNVYYCAVPTGNSTTNNKTFTYHRQYTGWLQSQNINANAWTQYVDSAQEERLYYADDVLPQVWVQTTGFVDDTAAIPMYWESKSYDFGTFDVQKRFVDVTLLFRQLSGNVKVTVTIDGNRITKTYNIPGTSFAGGMGRGLLGEASLGGYNEASVMGTTSSTVTNNIPIRLNIGENGRTIKIRVENSVANESFTLLGFNFGYRPYGRNNFPSELRVY